MGLGKKRPAQNNQYDMQVTENTTCYYPITYRVFRGHRHQRSIKPFRQKTVFQKILQMGDKAIC